MFHVWDSFLCEGDQVFFRIALALLKMAEPALLKINDPADLLMGVQSFPTTVTATRLKGVAFSKFCTGMGKKVGRMREVMRNNIKKREEKDRKEKLKLEREQEKREKAKEKGKDREKKESTTNAGGATLSSSSPTTKDVDDKSNAETEIELTLTSEEIPSMQPEGGDSQQQPELERTKSTEENIILEMNPEFAVDKQRFSLSYILRPDTFVNTNAAASNPSSLPEDNKLWRLSAHILQQKQQKLREQVPITAGSFPGRVTNECKQDI